MNYHSQQETWICNFVMRHQDVARKLQLYRQRADCWLAHMEKRWWRKVEGRGGVQQYFMPRVEWEQSSSSNQPTFVTRTCEYLVSLLTVVGIAREKIDIELQYFEETKVVLMNCIDLGTPSLDESFMEYRERLTRYQGEDSVDMIALLRHVRDEFEHLESPISTSTSLSDGGEAQVPVAPNNGQIFHQAWNAMVNRIENNDEEGNASSNQAAATLNDVMYELHTLREMLDDEFHTHYLEIHRAQNYALELIPSLLPRELCTVVAELHHMTHVLHETDSMLRNLALLIEPPSPSCSPRQMSSISTSTPSPAPSPAPSEQRTQSPPPQQKSPEDSGLPQNNPSHGGGCEKPSALTLKDLALKEVPENETLMTTSGNTRLTKQSLMSILRRSFKLKA